jgi:hypothetical protein
MDIAVADTIVGDIDGDVLRTKSSISKVHLVDVDAGGLNSVGRISNGRTRHYYGSVCRNIRENSALSL